MENKKLDEIICQERRKYFRQWRANNKDKVKKNNENYWRKKALQRIAEQKTNSETEVT